MKDELPSVLLPLDLLDDPKDTRLRTLRKTPAGVTPVVKYHSEGRFAATMVKPASRTIKVLPLSIALKDVFVIYGFSSGHEMDRDYHTSTAGTYTSQSEHEYTSYRKFPGYVCVQSPDLIVVSSSLLKALRVFIPVGLASPR